MIYLLRDKITGSIFRFTYKNTLFSFIKNHYEDNYLISLSIIVVDFHDRIKEGEKQLEMNVSKETIDAYVLSK